MAFLSPDGKFMRFVERLLDVLFLNLLWLAFCLPVVTIGASTVAAYAVALKMANEEEGYLFRNFWKAFKENFLQGTLLWILNAVAAYGLYIEWQFALKSPDPPLWLILLAILTSVLVFCAFIYAYPLAARYRNKLRNILENSFIICLRYYGRSLFLLLVLALEVGLFIWNVPLMVFGAVAGPMILIYTVSGVANGIFKDIDKTGGKRYPGKSAT